jgi:ubiquinone/menaquinone biosynthesis C-methylase UbiE
VLVATWPVMAEQLASRPAPEWITRLERPERIAELKIDEVIANLQLKPGTVVADLGAGPGVFTLPFAKAVAPGGKVYAVEIDQQFLDHIKRKTEEQNVSNTVLVLGKFSDPNLPAKDVDVAFFHDVLHHVEDRTGYLKNLAQYVKPSGRIVVIDLDPVKGSHRDDPKLRLSKEQVATWMADIGFKPVEEINMFDDKWFVVYGRAPRAQGGAAPRAQAAAPRAQGQAAAVEVYKSPTCRCCSKWIDHMRQHGFTVTSTDLPDMSVIKKKYNVPGSVSSCHTALVRGYIVEGHVPAPDVHRMLEQSPKVAGIAVPGMPTGSPGMEVEGRGVDPYDVVSFDAKGKVGVFASYPRQSTAPRRN